MKKLLLVINLTLALSLGLWLSPFKTAAQASSMVLGDVDQNSSVNIQDAIMALNYLFGRVSTLPCPAAADMDHSGSVNIQDAIFMLNHIFQPPLNWVWPTISSCTIDIIPPTVSLTSPASGATVSGTITLAANASDNVGVDRVEFYVDSSLPLGPVRTAP